ncbi:MAG: tRNA (adenosine(37)-N6)-threonylcarbamoyltransferase complex ATPase subunit type 1 TsaE [Bacilli bacterium]|nr:tRNA (adenosine(37)-N6)-threonylcarbamoyltransferase complex ATPase subunit type 1 TsaE [Bacilli bacterium]MDD3422823.1 tRNA (adenosine(37)-N6)-threonylcarbamoyltransferase complex ATPase subunit type 1 TsaE [Bacilli bacterium]MDD4066240.1 tRNA (adenosine(37)-N6)-threonylcarbamoyltransferase complex ATPase subunit type 1 TsaE [Bacilli bacterium]
MEWKVVTKNEQETLRLATLIGSLVQPHQVFLLEGNLGAGKTIFAKGLAKGLEIKDTVNSPTFNIVKPYFKGRIPFYHIDAYRLEDNHQDIGLDEYIDGNGVCAIEWPNYVSYLLPLEYIHVQIKRIDETKRQLVFTPKGQDNEKFLSEVQQKWEDIY